MGMDADPEPEVYVPYMATLWSHMVLVVRTRGDPNSVVRSLREAVLSVDPTISIEGQGTGIRTVESYRAESVATRQFSMWLALGLALCGVVFAVLGIYSVVSRSVEYRTREIGIRMSLGAAPFEILRFIVRDSAWPVVIGLLLGIGASFGLTRLLAAMLFGVGTLDPIAFVAAACLLGACAFVAIIIPARRASSVSPAQALQAE